MPVLIEAAIDSLATAERAVAEGANRLEVCSSLEVGGLTPTPELLRECLSLGVPCVAMARPRAGDFVYGTEERQLLIEHVTSMRDAGAHGVVFGVLARDQTVDDETVDAIVGLCSAIETIFHRAFDETTDAREAVETLVECGVTRILTSGHAATAAGGIHVIAALHEQADGRIEILPGGGVRADNVEEIVRRSRVSQIHARGTDPGVIAGIRNALSRQHRAAIRDPSPNP